MTDTDTTTDTTEAAHHGTPVGSTTDSVLHDRLNAADLLAAGYVEAAADDLEAAAAYGDEQPPDIPADQSTPEACEPRYLDPVTILTLAELDLGSRQLHADILQAVEPGDYRRSGALAVVAWLLTRRTEPGCKLGEFRAMTLEQLSPFVTILDTSDPADREPVEVDEDAPAPARPTSPGQQPG